mgnify:CR=1 FL=1
MDATEDKPTEIRKHIIEDELRELDAKLLSLDDLDTKKEELKDLFSNFCFENLNSEEINHIHEFGDVYFTLNRGEGFGLCTYTAKKIGNRIICGKFGAEKEFLDDNDLLLDYELRSSDYLNDHHKMYIGNDQKCAYYDTDYVVSKLQYYPKTIKNV